MIRLISLPFFALLYSISGSYASEFCERTHQNVLEQLQKSENRLSFENDGGLLNQGVCWWHSRFERAANYLARFRPDLPKPTHREAKALSRSLAHFKVAEIPGYSNLNEFSRDHQDAIQKVLNSWQARDGFIYQKWVFGLFGNHEISATAMKRRMKKIVRKFEKDPKPIFLMLQYEGISSHAHLLVGVKPLNDGYQLDVVDSNFKKSTRSELYTYNDTHLDPKDPFVPYIGFDGDFRKIKRSRTKYCQLSVD